MAVTECGCDTAREIEGLAAHLLERGAGDDVVLARLAGRFGLAVSGASAGETGPARSAVPVSNLPDGLAGIAGAAEVKRPQDVPTSARPASPSRPSTP